MEDGKNCMSLYLKGLLLYPFVGMLNQSFEEDLELIPAPKKHLKLGNFHILWKKGEVPVTTYLLLGNHEPFLYLSEYEKDGPKELIKNLWILRRSGVIELCGVKIAYLSRVFSPRTYFKEEVWDPCKDKRAKKSKLAGRFTIDDVENLIFKAAEEERIDILALHENPVFCRDERGKEVYHTIVEILSPKVIVCGHTHKSLKEMFAGIPVIGLSRGEVVPLSEILSIVP